MVRLKRKRQRKGRGVASVEMAIVLPLLLLLTLGLIEYSWMFLKKQTMTNSARQGARVGARLDATTGDILNAVDEVMTAAGLSGSGYTVTIDPLDVTSLAPGQPLRVTVQLSYNNIGLIQLPIIPTPNQLTSSAVMAREGV